MAHCPAHLLSYKFPQAVVNVSPVSALRRPALQHGDGGGGGSVRLHLGGPRPAAQPLPALRLLADVPGAAVHAGQQHAGRHQRGQQQRQHQQPGVLRQPTGARQRQGAGPRPGPGQPLHLGHVEVVGGSRGGGHVRLPIWRYLPRLEPHGTGVTQTRTPMPEREFVCK